MQLLESWDVNRSKWQSGWFIYQALGLNGVSARRRCNTRQERFQMAIPVPITVDTSGFVYKQVDGLCMI